LLVAIGLANAGTRADVAKAQLDRLRGVPGTATLTEAVSYAELAKAAGRDPASELREAAAGPGGGVAMLAALAVVTRSPDDVAALTASVKREHARLPSDPTTTAAFIVAKALAGDAAGARADLSASASLRAPDRDLALARVLVDRIGGDPAQAETAAAEALRRHPTLPDRFVALP
jgi:hypothetical protein